MRPAQASIRQLTSVKQVPGALGNPGGTRGHCGTARRSVSLPRLSARRVADATPAAPCPEVPGAPTGQTTC